MEEQEETEAENQEKEAIPEGDTPTEAWEKDMTEEVKAEDKQAAVEEVTMQEDVTTKDIHLMSFQNLTVG